MYCIFINGPSRIYKFMSAGWDLLLIQDLCTYKKYNIFLYVQNKFHDYIPVVKVE
jgi:hypothetical protein